MTNLEQKIADSTLILNEDGSIYHLNLHPEDIAETIILVGDPERVPSVSKHFDRIELQKQKREFVTHTGYIGQQRLTVLSTGMGVGNIDIVMNELDALANIDLKARCIKPQHTQLTLLRLGTSGALAEHVALDSLLISESAFAFDGTLNFYQQHYPAEQQALYSALQQHFSALPMAGGLYLGRAHESLLQLLDSDCQRGMTFTCSGFYGAQGRQLRTPLIAENVFELAQAFCHEDKVITNFEMETAAILNLGSLLGHACCSVNAIIAQRAQSTFSRDPKATVNRMIEKVLGLLVG